MSELGALKLASTLVTSDESQGLVQVRWTRGADALVFDALVPAFEFSVGLGMVRAGTENCGHPQSPMPATSAAGPYGTQLSAAMPVMSLNRSAVRSPPSVGGHNCTALRMNEKRE